MLKKLINELCPDGIEYKFFSEVAGFRRGATVTRKSLSDGEIPVLAGGKTPAYYCDKSNRHGETIVVAGSGAYAGFVSYWDTPVFVSDAFTVEPNKELLPKYLYYFLKTKQDYIYSQKTGGGVPHVYGKDLKKIRIPVPPSTIQAEIVRILDKFTLLKAELEAELEARTVQYEHYRDSLLNFSFDISTTYQTFLEGGSGNHNFIGFEEVKLQNLCLDISNVRWSSNQGKTFQYIDLSSVNRETKRITETMEIDSETAPSRAQQIVLKDDVIFGGTRPTLKRYTIIPEEFDGQICSTGYIVLRADSKRVMPKFLYYVVSTDKFNRHVEAYQRGSAYPAISEKDLKRYRFVLPSIPIQETIIEILDRFETVVHDIQDGLPAEIALRQKQYEYYRDKLLTFES
jgi:type I restriction enzyme S subunit